MKKHTMFTKALLVMLLLLFVSTTATVNAFTTADDDNGTDDTTTTTTEDEHGNDNSTDDSSDDDVNERALQVDVTTSEAEVQSKLRSGVNEDTFRIRVRTGENGVEFKVAYEFENATTESEHEFEVTFQELVEYIDTNGNGVYDNEVDSDVQTLVLSSFNPIMYTIENGTNGNVHVFEISTSDGIFTVRTFAAGDFETINGTIVAPTQMKIDILINGFNFTEDNSKLALSVKLEASTDTSYQEDTEDEEDGRANDEAAIDVNMSEFNGFFSWKETAEIDGVVYPVNSSIAEVSSHENRIYLNYERGDIIIHDPKVGFENILRASGTSSLVGGLGDFLTGDYLPITLAAVGAVAVIGILFIVKRRS